MNEMRKNPADATIWVPNVLTCPVCGSINPHILQEGNAVVDMNTNKFHFQTNQPYFYVYCTKCEHLSNPFYSIKDALEDWQTADEWENRWWDQIKC